MEHSLFYYMSVSNRYSAEVDENGDIVLSGDFSTEDVIDTELYCSECDSEGLDKYDYHNISREYEVY